jgi:hypothetical protein
MGLVPNWIADHDPAHYACGFNWPYRTGVWNSGGLGATSWVFAAKTVTWQIWDTDASDFGSPTSGNDVDAWWGDLPAWQMNWTGGTPSVDGNSLCYSVTAGGSGTFEAMIPGAVEADEADTDSDYNVPWDDEKGINVKVRFKLTTAGSLSEAGSRDWTFGWHDTRELVYGHVFFGDTGHAQGLALFSDDSESTFVAKDIVEGQWHWLRIDTRHPTKNRMKMWRETYQDAEPVAWDVDLDVEDDTDRPTTDNFLKMVITLGNMTGAAQSLCIDKILMAGAGLPFHWVEDYIGDGDDSTADFATAQPFIDGTFALTVDGLHTRAKTVDIDTGEFTALQRYPAADGARMTTRYVVAPPADDV